MDNRLIPADSGIREEPLDPIEVLLGRSLDGLDAIVENSLASIEQGGQCDQMINSSLRYLDDVTDGVRDGDATSLDDVVLRRDLSSLDNLITTTTNRLRDDREDSLGADEATQPGA